jgi:hypothetical protein
MESGQGWLHFEICPNFGCQKLQSKVDIVIEMLNPLEDGIVLGIVCPNNSDQLSLARKGRECVVTF